MGNDHPALRALFACESGLQNRKSGWSTPSLLCSFDLANDNKWQNSHGARVQKHLQTALNLSVTFI
jgi:hypothetical protein